MIEGAKGPLKELFGVCKGDSISLILPRLPWPPREEHREVSCHGATTLTGKTFPVLLRTLKTPSGSHDVQLISMANFAGMISVNDAGVVTSCNAAFMQYLFGHDADQLVNNRRPITNLIPDFERIKQHVRGLSASTPVVSANTCRRLLKRPEGDGVMLVHRDGTPMQADLQVRVMMENEQPVYALWIAFERPVAVSGVSEATEAKLDKAIDVSLTNIDLLIPLKSVKISDAGNHGKTSTMDAIDAKAKAINAVVVSTNAKPVVEQSRAPQTFRLFDQDCRVEDYKVVQKLGEGAFGSVHLVRHHTQSVHYNHNYIFIVHSAWRF